MINHIALTYACKKKCSFCIAKDIINKDNKFISLKNFERVLDWFKKQNISHVSLFGGEPTLHPKLKEIVKLLEKKKMSAGMLTNGLFSYDVIGRFSIKTIVNYLINYNPKQHYTKKEWEILHHNLKKLSAKNDRIITLSYNMSLTNLEYKHYIDTCKKYKIKKIRFTLTAPSAKKTNDYSSFEKMKEMVPIILSFVKESSNEGINLQLDGPLPFCLFSNRERLFMKKKANLYGTCESAKTTLLVNPDLEVYPCLPIMIKGPNLLSFKNREEIFNFYKDKINEMKWNRDLLPECGSCKHKRRRECQGGCLSYFI